MSPPRHAFLSLCVYLLRLRGDVCLAGLGGGCYRNPS